MLTQTNTKCDYKNGIVYVHPSLEGTAITIARYAGKGYKSLYARRVKISDQDNYYSSTNAEGAFKEIYEKVENIIINSGEQSAEIVDARYDSNSGTTHTTLANRLNAEYGEVYDARTNANTVPVVYDSLKDRLDSEKAEFDSLKEY